MPSSDLAARCRRLAKEMTGDPIEAALLRLAEKYEAAGDSSLRVPSPDLQLPGNPARV